MGFLELAGVVLILGVALPVGVGVIREIAGAVDVAEAAVTKAGIVAAVGKTAVAEARAAAGKAPAMEPAATVKAAEAAATVKAAGPVETSETTPAAEGDGMLGPDREARGDCRPRHQRSAQFFSTQELLDHRYPPGATWPP
jgi:hypothetical protein